jgi:transposase
VSKVELFELIRRDHYIQGHGIRRIARERGIHRRLVRQALSAALPPPRRSPVREPQVLTWALREVIDQWLAADQDAPRKQRHTGTRIYERLVQEQGYQGSAVTVRMYVGRRRREVNLPAEAYVPQGYVPGQEAQVDWYEAEVEFASGRQTVQFFVMRACYSGREFHHAFPRQTQQAFLEGHVAAFAYFGGVFARLRYDNLGAAVKKVLRGRRREETERFIALRSHYLFEADFCQPGPLGAHEKGGVENSVGRFRRHHLVPVPVLEDLRALNDYLHTACQTDDSRRLTGRGQPIAVDWAAEQAALRALPSLPFASAEVTPCRVDSSARIRVRTNHYSVPVALVGKRVEVRLHATWLEVVQGGRVVACHERLQGRFGEQLSLDHYLELLERKPGAFPRARALQHARRTGHWPVVYDTLFSELQRRYGDTEGTRQLLKVILLHRDYPAAQVLEAVNQALTLGCCEAAAIAVLLRQHGSTPAAPACLTALGELGRYGQARAEGLHIYEALRQHPAPEVVYG